MADISKLTLPSGTTYDLKDEITRKFVFGSLNAYKYTPNTEYQKGEITWNKVGDDYQFVYCDRDLTASQNPNWTTFSAYFTIRDSFGIFQYLQNEISAIDSLSYAISKTAADTPLGVENFYTGVSVIGTLAPSKYTLKKMYLVKTSATAGEDVYNEYLTIQDGGDYTWEKVGSTSSSFEFDTVQVVKNISVDKTTDSTLGKDTTFTLSDVDVTLSTDTLENDTIFNDDEFVYKTEYTVANEVLTISESTTVKVPTVKTFSIDYATDVDEITQPEVTVGTNDLVDSVITVTPSITKEVVMKEKATFTGTYNITSGTFAGKNGATLTFASPSNFYSATAKTSATLIHNGGWMLSDLSWVGANNAALEELGFNLSSGNWDTDLDFVAGATGTKVTITLTRV